LKLIDKMLNKMTPLAFVGMAAADLPLVTFDGTPATTFTFKELNDPVMGGQSTGTWTVNSSAGFGQFQGHVVNVPKLKAPGFIKASADGKFADASSALGGDLVLKVRSSTPNYAGFRVSFASGTLAPSYACAGGGSIPFSRGCYKAHFTVPENSTQWTDVRVPFSSFSDMWSPATGNQTKLCKDDPDVCPTAHVLANIIRFEVWAEGVDGAPSLDIKSFSASPTTMKPSSALKVAPPAQFDTCKHRVQANLRFGISGRTTPEGLPVNANEGLAEAVCCDHRTLALAEPQFLFEAPDVSLFSKMDQTGVTTFYDSVCGLPLFRTPVNRTLDDFQADTTEHGWPSFREAEVFHANVVTDRKLGGLVSSKCGTHLGTFLPDEQGARWCMDLSCISGNKA
jgi:peptide methionine sulfoxide reductase MsrB